jgi:hypothetical protein
LRAVVVPVPELKAAIQMSPLGASAKEVMRSALSGELELVKEVQLPASKSASPPTSSPEPIHSRFWESKSTSSTRSLASGAFEVSSQVQFGSVTCGGGNMSLLSPPISSQRW